MPRRTARVAGRTFDPQALDAATGAIPLPDLVGLEDDAQPFDGPRDVGAVADDTRPATTGVHDDELIVRTHIRAGAGDVRSICNTGHR